MDCRTHQRKEENRQNKWKKVEECEESQITTIYTLVLNYIWLENITWKKFVYTIKFYLQFLCVSGYFKHSNDTSNLNIHKHTNYNIIEIYINKLSATTQVFIAVDYLIMMSETEKNIWQGHFFLPHRSNWIHVLWKYFPNYVFTKDMYKNLKEIGIIQDVSKLIIFIKLWVISFTAVYADKKIETMKPWVHWVEFFCVRSILLVQNIIWFIFFEERW